MSLFFVSVNGVVVKRLDFIRLLLDATRLSAHRGEAFYCIYARVIGALCDCFFFVFYHVCVSSLWGKEARQLRVHLPCRVWAAVTKAQ